MNQESLKESSFHRNCPICGKLIYHTNKFYRNYAHKQGRTCKSCRMLGEKHPRYGKRCPPNVSKAVAAANRKRIWTEADRSKMSQSLKGRTFTEEHKRKIGNANRNKVVSAETRQKLRLAAIKQKEQLHGQLVPMYNPDACRLFEIINNELNLNGMHAENGGEYHIKELGYWVDYYEPTSNLIIEYDESHHFNDAGQLRKKDIKRQQEIERKLKCKFIRIRSDMELQDVLNFIRNQIAP